jgi:Spy/CpxP family protein refolding chaperone
MKTARIAQILSTAALVSLGLMAGTSQADNSGFYANANAPEFNRPGVAPGFGPDRGPGFCPPRGEALSIDLRQRQQVERIFEGLRSGQLTRHEARDLMDEQRRIEHLERQYLADGRLSRDEWLDLERRLDEASRDIREEKHDYDRRGDRHAWR